jgi:DNA-binding NtrC family response regulator
MSEPDRHTLALTGVSTSNVKNRGALREVRVKVTGGPSRGQQLAVGGRAIVIGADAEADLVLEDPKVSRKHVSLKVVPEGIEVKDLGSTNGVFADGVKVTQAVVLPGASLKVGGTTLKLEAAGARVVQPSERSRFGGLVGESTPIRELFAVLELAAPTEATVLVQGESGTGKELAARALHDHSTRAKGPFVVVDCSGAAESLLESQLFGHKKGAFTGAAAEREGAFVAAKGGTVFIDEIGELPLPSQARLLRALEARTVQPLGSDTQVPIDVRVVAATHRDLRAMTDEKTFRFDLFHRLAVVHAFLPPLRERLEDLGVLVQHFYEGRGARAGEVKGENLDRLRGYRWPGNVRELRNVLERSFVLAGPTPPPFSELALWLEPGNDGPADVVDIAMPFKEAKERWVSGFERRYLVAVLARYGGNLTHAAGHAGINRRHFRERLEALGLRSDD